MISAAPSDNIPSSLTTVTMGGGAVGFNWLPIIVAQRKGFFRRRGLEVEVQKLGSVDKATAAVKAGTVQLAITPPEGAIKDAINGGHLRIVAGNVNRLPMTLVANSKFKRVEDLRGAVLGTSSLTEGTAIYTIEILSRHGLSYPGDFTFSVVGVHPARWKALQEGAIDAAVQLIPLNFVAIDNDYSNLGEASAYIDEIAFTAFIADEGWASENSAVLESLLAAVHDAVSWMYTAGHDADLIAWVRELTQADETYGPRSLDYMVQKTVFQRDLAVTGKAFAMTVKLMVKAGLLTEAEAGNAGHALNDRYRTAALASER